ncbi:MULTISPECIES: AraC family transcriptional regulator [unclassified Oceanispirochaeta]|uniref:AraC family transcriptional regulator n=1 Tax=unclassified Oceanispirochaeta TaxID=2635722 RepID=UPI000E08D8FB|nr:MULTISPECIES: AraC family transcriptional regulator [unclassified Oceanispirochaeta]MBF9014623.1 helix-turn-helix domain-containing protein [Oceanispirochaeta sp. M2]NPD70879.1 helix-turn-helix transcriptional regulator [Oceanispirochaeta sp. M1]RDG34158.1 AraC family transcriptional regulator [Oceanispirochaeta sp. M1]
MSREQFELPLPEMPRLSHFGFSDSMEKCNFGSHYHFGYELIYVSRGSADIELFKGKPPVHLEEDDLCIVSPSAVHEFIYDHQVLSFYWMGFQTGLKIAVSEGHMIPPYQLLRREKSKTVQFQEIYNNEIDGIVGEFNIEDFHIFRKAPGFLPLFESIKKELHWIDPYSSQIIYQKILEIFIRIARLLQSEVRSENKGIAYVRNYIEAHCRESINLGELSCRAGYSQEHLSRYFKDTFGKTPKQYHNEKRLNAARQFLTARGSVQDAAVYCGFNSSSYFSSWFRGLTGTSPKNY